MRLPLMFVALVGLLAACEDPRALSEDFGASVRHNMAVQIINPVPGDDVGPATLDGRRAGDAWERYRSGTVTKPRGMSTFSDNFSASEPKN